MKLAFSTLGCPEWSWEKIIDEAAGMGFEGIELRGIEGEIFLPKARPFLPENIRKTLAQLKERKLEIPALGSSCSFHDVKDYDAAVEEGKATIDLAAQIGTPFIRVFGNNVPDPAKKAEVVERISKGINELCRHCAGKNVYVLLETHGDFSDLDNLFPVVDNIKDPHFGLLWDVEHTYTELGEDNSEFMKKAAKYIKHTHIKDTLKTGGGFQLCLTGEGNVPILKDIELLKAIGYNEYLSFEWEKKWHPELEEPEIAFPGYIKYMKKILGEGGD